MSIKEVLEKKKKLKTIVYIDYDNVLERFSALGVTINQLDFFEKLKAKFDEEGLFICDIIAYANFEKAELFNVAHQTQLRHKGVLTKHCSSDGKNSGDLEMTVDVLVDLFKNNTIEAFVIVSNDRDFIPLIKAIKKENKLAILSSSKKGLNKIISTYADFTFYFEDMFEMPEKSKVTDTSIGRANAIEFDDITEELKVKAQEIVNNLYKSHFWKKYESDNTQTVRLQGYAVQAAKIMKVLKDDAIKYFEVAHKLGIIELFIDETNEQVCIRKLIKAEEE